MLMYPDEYNEFSHLTKRYVVLNVLIKVLEYDKKVIKASTSKLIRVYEELLTEIQWKIEHDLIQIKKEMKQLGGTIIEEQQHSSVRIVKVKFRGFVYTYRFLNYLLQAESEQLFKEYAMHYRGSST